VRPSPVTPPVTQARPPVVSVFLAIAAFCLAGVGITMNGWFAYSLGSGDLARLLFMAVGVGADCVALLMPASASLLWNGRRRLTAVVGWVIWLFEASGRRRRP
jgi:hypothetical protein